MAIPVLGGCLQSIALGRMAWALSIAVQAGLDARNSAKVALSATQNVLYSEKIELVDREIAAGNEIHEGLRAAGVFPPEFVDAVEVGERAGRLEDAMQRLSKQYDDQSQAASTGLALVVAFATWGLVAMVLILLIIRLAISYRDMILGIEI
jgi:type II secretory pathway component PulF